MCIGLRYTLFSLWLFFLCTKSFRSAFRLPRAHHYRALQFVETQTEVMCLVRPTVYIEGQNTKHQGKEVTEGSSPHILSPSVTVPHGLVLLYSDPVITLSKCLTDFSRDTMEAQQRTLGGHVLMIAIHSIYRGVRSGLVWTSRFADRRPEVRDEGGGTAQIHSYKS